MNSHLRLALIMGWVTLLLLSCEPLADNVFSQELTPVLLVHHKMTSFWISGSRTSDLLARTGDFYAELPLVCIVYLLLAARVRFLGSVLNELVYTLSCLLSSSFPTTVFGIDPLYASFWPLWIL